jgi:hypothetical protein
VTPASDGRSGVPWARALPVLRQPAQSSGPRNVPFFRAAADRGVAGLSRSETPGPEPSLGRVGSFGFACRCSFLFSPSLGARLQPGAVEANYPDDSKEFVPRFMFC